MDNFQIFFEKKTNVFTGGILLYHVTKKGKIKVFLITPGGPFYDFGKSTKWGIPKGRQDKGEDIFDTAKREFYEETGIKLKGKDKKYITLGSTKRGHKPTRHMAVWAYEGTGDEKFIKSNTFEIEWPRHSGKMRKFPEIDRGEWVEIDVAISMLQQYQTTFLKRLKEHLKYSK